MILSPAAMTAFDPTEIALILSRGEGRQVEFKEGLAPDGRVARTLCAFANTRGGVLLVGVSDRGRPLGAPRHARVVADLNALATDEIVPAVPVRTGVARVAGVSVVWCSVPLSPARPHAVRSGPGGAPAVLVRIGSSNRVADGKQIAMLAGPASRRLSPTALESRILDAIARSRTGISVEACAHAVSIGKQRARQELERLERAGRVIAHGLSDSRLYERA